MSKFSLAFDPPVMNAAGSLGFAPNPHGAVDLRRLGTFITNPVSLRARTPARGRRFIPYPGGFLLHTGHPNPGLRSVVHHHSAQWSRSPLPVWVHLLAQESNELARMVRSLESVEGIAGVEIGLVPDVSAEAVGPFLTAAQGELPVIVRLPLERASELAESSIAAGAAAVSLGAPRGALTTNGGELAQGRLYGPAIFPLALAVVRTLAVRGVAVIGAGGVYGQSDIDAMLSAGALAVQLDAGLWLGY
jgi:dihydroorotate dehydrogenase (NAD+) catalytic subunit